MQCAIQYKAVEALLQAQRETPLFELAELLGE